MLHDSTVSDFVQYVSSCTVLVNIQSDGSHRCPPKGTKWRQANSSTPLGSWKCQTQGERILHDITVEADVYRLNVIMMI